MVCKRAKKRPKGRRKLRFYATLTNAMKGGIFFIQLEEEECMVGARYSGLKNMHEYPKNVQSCAFIVLKGLYKSILALRRSRENLEAICLV